MGGYMVCTYVSTLCIYVRKLAKKRKPFLSNDLLSEGPLSRRWIARERLIRHERCYIESHLVREKVWGNRNSLWGKSIPCYKLLTLCFYLTWLLLVAVVRLHVGDLYTVGCCEGPWTLVTTEKAIKVGVGFYKICFAIQLVSGQIKELYHLIYWFDIIPIQYLLVKTEVLKHNGRGGICVCLLLWPRWCMHSTPTLRVRILLKPTYLKGTKEANVGSVKNRHFWYNYLFQPFIWF